MHLPTIFRRGVPALAVTALAGIAVLPSERTVTPEETTPASAAPVEAAEAPSTAETPSAAEAPAAAEALPRPVLEVHRGEATYYADALHGRTTASGVPYDRNALVAAHRTLPFGTLLRVTNTDNGRQVLVRVVDRGPFAPGRRAPAILDLSRRAARELGFIRQGRVLVRADVLEWGEG